MYFLDSNSYNVHIKPSAVTKFAAYMARIGESFSVKTVN